MVKKNSLIAPTAADLVGAAESIALGCDSAAHVFAAAAAVEATFSAASAQLFRPAVSAAHADAAVLALATWHIERAGLAARGDKLSAVHKAALVESPTLALLLRTAEVVESVREASIATAHVAGGHFLESIGDRERRVGDAAVRRFQVEIATQLVAADVEAVAARAYLAAVDLEQRLVVVRERHAAHTADEAVRAEHEAKEAADRARAARLEEVASARAAFEAARLEAERTSHAYRDILADVLVERIRADQVESLRHEHQVWDTRLIIDRSDGFGIEQLLEFTAALERHEANAS